MVCGLVAYPNSVMEILVDTILKRFLTVPLHIPHVLPVKDVTEGVLDRVVGCGNVGALEPDLSCFP